MTDPIYTGDDLPSEPNTITSSENQDAVKKNVKVSEIQTDKNTLFDQPVPMGTDSLGDYKEDESQPTQLNAFLNMTPASLKRLSTTIGLWLQSTTSAVEASKDYNLVSKANAALQVFKEHIAKEYPEKSIDEISTLCANYYNFNSNLVQGHMLKYIFNNQKDLSSESNRATGVVGSDITAITPGNASKKKFGMAEAMRRSYRKGVAEAENIDILLRNSFVNIRIAKPTLLELSSMIEDVHNQIKGYARRLNGNSLTLSRINSYRTIFKFVVNSMVQSSVKGLTDYANLDKIITYNDFGSILVGLMSSVSHKGVNMGLTCLHDGCDWNSYALIDPTKLIKHDNNALDADLAAVMANIQNGTGRYSPEEIAKFKAKVKYSVDGKVYFEDDKFLFVLKDPSLRTTFTTFDQFIEFFEPKLQTLQSQIIDQKEYATAYTSLVTSMGGMEYMQWIDEYHVIADPSSDEETQIYRRSDGDEREFNSGLMSVLSDSSEASTSLIKAVYSMAPLLSQTAIGISNYTCPNCGKSSGETNLAPLGITPVDPFMLFFIHTQDLYRRWVGEMGLTQLHQEQSMGQ